MPETHVSESPQTQAQAQTNTSYCSSVPFSAVCAVAFILLLTESDTPVKMTEGLGFVLNYTERLEKGEFCVHPM